MALGLRIRSKVNWVQNNEKMYKNSFQCHSFAVFSTKFHRNYIIYTYYACGIYSITKESVKHILARLKVISVQNYEVIHKIPPGANLTYLAPQDNFSWVPNHSLGPQKCNEFLSLKINSFAL